MLYYRINNILKGSNVLYCIKKTILFTSIILFIVSCSTVKVVNLTELERDLSYIGVKLRDSDFNQIETLLFVDVDRQTLFFIKKGFISSKYLVSTSYYGVGGEENSLKTPIGKHVISEKIGTNLPNGAILKGRKWTGEIAEVVRDKLDTDLDIVTSRILWLDGQEVGLNKGEGFDSKSRYIYIHGTAEEGLIGNPASDGCVRMYNKDIIELFSKVQVNTPVWIY